MSRANVSSRVEDIKKRLEAASNAPLLSPEKLLLASANRQKNESTVRANIPATFLTPHSDIPRRKSPNMASTIMTQHSEAGKRKSLSPVRSSPVKLDRQLSSPGSRGNNVRRSPAFRCDKMVKGRNVVGQRPRSFVDTSLNRDEVKVKRLNSSPTKKPVKLLDSPKKNDTKGVVKPEITYPKPKPSISPPKALSDIPRNPKIEYAVVNKALKTKKHVSDIRNVFLSENKSEETDINSEMFKKPSTKEDFQNPSQLAILSSDNANINGVFCDKMPVYGVNENYPEVEEFMDNKYGKIAMSPTVDESSGHEYGKISTTRKPSVKANPHEYSKVSLSNTLRAVLSSPLPAGPPPRKPPRTFAHATASQQSAVRDRVQKFNNVAITSQQTVPKLSPKPYIPGKTANLNQVANILRPSNGSNVRMSPTALTAQVGLTKSPPQRPTRSKTESEIMLRKLENVLKNHQKTGVVIHPTTSPPAPSTKSSQPETRPRHQIPDASQNESRVGWLESFSCINRPETMSYQKLNENNSEFFVALPTEEHRNNSNIRRSSSVEHIYAIPFEFNGKSPDERSALSLEARRRTPPRKILAVTPEKIVEIGQFRGKMEEGDSRVDDGGLHYLSSPVSSEMDAPHALAGASPGEQEKSKALRPKPGLLRLAGLVRGAEKPNQEKIQQIMNQAFGIPHGPEVSGSDESPSSTPDESLDFAASIAEPLEEAKTNSGSESLTESTELRQLTERRKTYVRRVSCRIAPTKQPHMFPHLFQYVLLVGLNLGCGINKPYIKRKYPADAEVTPHIEEFCFPDASAWPRKAHANGTPDEQSYSLVITNDKGDRTFGYCRRVMPEGADVCLPLAYCIISPFRATGFYYKVLSELESRHGQPEVLQTSFIMELYNCSLPGPGQSLKPNADLGLTSPVANTVRSTLDSAHMVLTANFQAMNGANGESKMENGVSSEGDSNRGRLVHSSTIVRRPLDLRLEEQDLTQLFSAVSVSDLLLLFGSLLLERKVVLFSESLSKLSSCVEALQSILYPFSWQHTFIPVLPISQIEYCDAPTPYIFGILKQAGQVPDVEITDGIAVDVDTSRVLISVGDEATILPTRLRRSLKTALQLVGQLTQPTEAARNVLVSEAFVRAFVEVCGHYQTHIIARPEGRHFEREAFVAAGTCRAERSFLEWFSETAMFRRFLEVRMERGNRFRGVFEQRARERKDEIEKNIVLGRPNKKHRTLGDRFKEWTPFT